MNPRDLLPAMPVRCECGGPVAVFSNPPGQPKAYGWCLACGSAVEISKRPPAAAAVDPSGDASTGNPSTREASS